MTTGKAIALTRQTSVGKVMSLLFSMLSRLVIAFLPRSKRLLILWLQWPSEIILELKKIKSVTVSIASPSICHVSSSLAFHTMHYAYTLNKQGDSTQPWRAPFPIWDQSIVPCLVLAVASWPAYRFLRRQVRWSGILISWRISTVCCDPHSQSL